MYNRTYIGTREAKGVRARQEFWLVLHIVESAVTNSTMEEIFHIFFGAF